MILTRPHIVCLLLAIVSFATSAPSPLRPHAVLADLRNASLIQIDDDEEREILPEQLETGDDEDDDPAEDGDGSE